MGNNKTEGEKTAFTKPMDTAHQKQSESLVKGIYEGHIHQKQEAVKDGKVDDKEKTALTKENEKALHTLREQYKGVLDERYQVQGYATKGGESKLLVSDKKEKGAVFVVDADTGKIEGKYKKDANGKLVEDLEFKKNLKEGNVETKPGVHHDTQGRIDDVRTGDSKHWHATYKGAEKEPTEVKLENGKETVTYVRENGKCYEVDAKGQKTEIQNFKVDGDGDLSVTKKMTDGQMTTEHFHSGGVALHEQFNDKHENMTLGNGYGDKRQANWDQNGNLQSALLHDGKRVNVTDEKTAGGKPIYEDENHHKYTVSADRDTGVMSYTALDEQGNPKFTSTCYPDGRMRTLDHANGVYHNRPPYEQSKH